MGERIRLGVPVTALRATYGTLLMDTTANIKEATSLGRHSTGDLTINVYANTPYSGLHEITECVGKMALNGPDIPEEDVSITGS